MRVKKRISKRVNSRQRNRIQKKVSEHHRKARKLAKQNPQWKSKKPKDLGVPNSFPFKEEVLAEREEVRRRREEERRKKKEGKKEEAEGNGNEAKGTNGVEANGNGLKVGLQVDSDDETTKEEDSDMSYEEGSDEDEEYLEEDEDVEEDDDGAAIEDNEESEWEGIPSTPSEDGNGEISDVDELTELNTARNSAPPPHLKAMNRSDLLIFVLEACAPEATRLPDVEAWAQKKGKDALFVLNGAEIVPPEVLQAWTEYLSSIFPTISVLNSESLHQHSLTPSKSLSILKSKIQETSKTATLLGLPQVGKTSLLNDLRNRQVQSKPTSVLRAYQLDNTEVIDTPGTFPPKLNPLLPFLLGMKASQENITALINVLDVMGDKWYKQLEEVYEMPALVRPMKGNRFINPTKDLLVHVARKFGRVGRQGPNLEGAAEIVGSDCASGKIKWWTLPPKTAES